MKCPYCNKKGELIKKTFESIMFYCWNCEIIYHNEDWGANEEKLIELREKEKR